MPDVRLTGFSTIIRHHPTYDTTFLGYASVILAKGLCTQTAHLCRYNTGARSFDSGAWALTCSVRRLNKTGEIRIDVPAIKCCGDGMWHPVVKLAPGVRESILHELTPHLPTEEEITTVVEANQ